MPLPKEYACARVLMGVLPTASATADAVTITCHNPAGLPMVCSCFPGLQKTRANTAQNADMSKQSRDNPGNFKRAFRRSRTMAQRPERSYRRRGAMAAWRLRPALVEPCNQM
jgi:hypothetical protein